MIAAPLHHASKAAGASSSGCWGRNSRLQLGDRPGSVAERLGKSLILGAACQLRERTGQEDEIVEIVHSRESTLHGFSCLVRSEV